MINQPIWLYHISSFFHPPLFTTLLRPSLSSLHPCFSLGFVSNLSFPLYFSPAIQRSIPLFSTFRSISLQCIQPIKHGNIQFSVMDKSVCHGHKILLVRHIYWHNFHQRTIYYHFSMVVMHIFFWGGGGGQQHNTPSKITSLWLFFRTLDFLLWTS